MDRKSQEQEQIRQLIALGDSARGLLHAEISSLRQKLDLPARIRGSLTRHPSSWLAGSLVSGLAASLLLRRKPAAAAKSRSIPTSLIGLILTAGRPVLKLWLAGLAKQWAAGAFAGRSSQAPESIHRYPLSTPSSDPSHVHSPGPGSR